MMFILLPILLFGISGIVSGANTYKGKEAWGYINVRQDAYMFWWLYYTDVAQGYANYPLIIWLQGGPGASSTGYGNFMEIGPFDINMKPRNTSWIQKANLLFLDNPVGSGFSYVTNASALATNNTQIAEDLLTTLSSLLQNIPEFQKTPLYIFSESYGGKMAVDFSLHLFEAIKAGKISCNFKGVALGDSWISPIDSVATWGTFLYSTSLISKVELQQLNVEVDVIRKDLQAKKFVDATQQFQVLQDLIANMTNNVDFYNILKHEALASNQTINKFAKGDKLRTLFARHVGYLYGDPLTDFMNSVVREKLRVIPKNVTWGEQSADVFKALQEDFMKPVVDSVDRLLNETMLSVNVYSGQLDLIVDTLGTLNWVENLKWAGVKGYLNAPRKVITLGQNESAAFVSAFKNFRFFWLLKAGHMVPADAGDAALKMVDLILSK